MEFDLAPRTLLLTVAGSHAYGMATPESDLDIRGVAVAPLGYYTGFLHRFQQTSVPGDFYWQRLREIWSHQDLVFHLNKWPEAEHAKDFQVMDIQKFCKLASDGNPNVLEQLFLPYDCIIGMRVAFTRIWRMRDVFLSKKVRHTFAGYAYSQIKRIRGHRRWLQDPPKKPPERGDFGLPASSLIPKDQWQAAESMVQKRIEEWMLNPEEEIPVTVLTRMQEALTDLVATISHDQDPELVMFRAAGRQLGLDDNFIHLLDCERRFRAAKRDWKQYQTWLLERNPARAEMEARFGYDCKHAAHVVRLSRCCEELLTTGQLHVDRRGRDADELLAIRRGAWTYEKLEEFAEAIDRRMDVLYKDPKCPLPHEPDRKAIDRACARIVETFPET
jgi:hypothetical protein